MRYCPACRNQTNGKYCGDCGSKLSEARVCPVCNTNSSAAFCLECGYSFETAATSADNFRPDKGKPALAFAPKSKYFRTSLANFKVLLLGVIACVLLISLIYLLNTSKSFSMAAKNPPVVTNSIIVSTLHSQSVLNVLEYQASASYQITDPAQFTFFKFTIELPFLAKTVTVNYNYKLTFGVDLSSVTQDDVRVSDRTLALVLPKPIDTTLSISNEVARMDGGFPGSSAYENALKLDPAHQPLTNALMNHAMNTLKQSGEYQKLQDKAMIQARDAIEKLLRTAVGNDISIHISFK